MTKSAGYASLLPPYEFLRFVRDMRRATVSDVANTCEQAGVAVTA